MPCPLQLPAWTALAEHHQHIRELHMRDLFADDNERFKHFSRRFGDLLLDFSKHRLTRETFDLLIELAWQAEVKPWIEKLFTGESVNVTQNRPALHFALRNRSNRPILYQGQDVMPGIQRVLDQMHRFSDRVRSGAWRGYTGRPIRDVVNIGIGGSDLGPRLVCQALQPYSNTDLRVHFLSNADGAHFCQTLQGCDPETTLFIVASKSFNTRETMANAEAARIWLLSVLGDEAAIARHFVAVSANLNAVRAFGIDPHNMFEFWDWVGGRYSLWSAIGLPIALAIGMERFEELLAGAHSMDEHFRQTPLRDNLPVILALLGIWYRNFFGSETQAVLIYDEYLRALPAYLQQLEMESTGKTVNRQGQPVTYATGPVVWGGLGNNGQHAFYQLLHQGAPLVPADFFIAVHSQAPLGEHQDILLANCLAQAEALMTGRSEAQARNDMASQGLDAATIERLLPHKVCPGNRPSTMLVYQKLTPRTLGALLALYEHKVFVQGVIWNLNPFDQWGIEIGKQLAGHLLPELHGTQPLGDHDASTRELLRYCRR